MDYGHIRQQSADLEKLVIRYDMAFFILHAISTLDPY
jgi:hypothetical protein